MIDLTFDVNGITKETKQLSEDALVTGDIYRSHRFNLNIIGDHLTVKVEGHVYSEDVGIRFDVAPWR